jgi:hypothetical protein
MLMASEEYEKNLSKIKVLILLFLDSLEGEPHKRKKTCKSRYFCFQDISEWRMGNYTSSIAMAHTARWMLT